MKLSAYDINVKLSTYDIFSRGTEGDTPCKG